MFLCYGQGLEFDIKYYILHGFGTSTPFKEKCYDHFKDPQILMSPDVVARRSYELNA